SSQLSSFTFVAVLPGVTILVVIVVIVAVVIVVVLPVLVAAPLVQLNVAAGELARRAVEEFSRDVEEANREAVLVLARLAVVAHENRVAAGDAVDVGSARDETGRGIELFVSR